MKLDKQQQLLHLKLLEERFFFDIELSANCNLNCNFCPREYIKRNNKQMSKTLAKKLNIWLPKKCNIMFSGMGEPLLYNDLFKITDNLYNSKRIIGITTNGQLLNEKIIEKIFTSKIDFLQISVNELDNIKYQKLSGGQDNSKIFKAINEIFNKNKKIDLQFSFVSDNLSKKEIKKQTDFSKKYNAIYFSKKLHNRGGYFSINNNKSYNNCFIFSQITYINSDGDILYCCHDLQSKNIIGNINTHTFSDIIEIKKNIIKKNKWHKQCEICNDAGRETIIKYE
jgi:MoaA/NifB/PqqE/SkfB family radical SAM enzyme